MATCVQHCCIGFEHQAYDWDPHLDRAFFTIMRFMGANQGWSGLTLSTETVRQTDDIPCRTVMQ